MATDLRAIIFEAIRADAQIAEMVGDRIVQRGSWDPEDSTVTPLETPYLVYSMSDEAPTGPSAMNATRRYLMVWAHDLPGDYYRIDVILDRVKEVLHAVPHGGQFYEVRFLLKSPDLFDDLLKHIVRYSRFYAVLAE